MNLVQDLRFALRQLRRSPGFALTAILTLALGIGANTAIFSLLDQALLRSLPVRDPQQLVILEGTGKAWEGHSSTHGGDAEAYFSYPMYKDFRDHSQALQGLIATSPAEIDTVWHNNAQVAQSEIVSGNYFPVLGAQPFLGRLLTPADDNAPGANPVAVLSYAFWKNHLGGDPALVGQTLSLNGHPFQIVGIASPSFHSAVWGQTPALFVPMSMLGEIVPGQAARLTNHKDRWLNILGRMRLGETTAQTQAAVAPLWYALRAEELKALGQKPPRFTQEFLTDSRLLVLPGARGFSYSREGLEKPLRIVMAMAALVLLLSSINVAGLLLVRSAGRVREFSLRAALGASNRRVFGQLMIEGLLIGVLGGAAGLLLAPLAIRILISRLQGSDGTNIFSGTLDHRILLFNFAMAILVSLGFSLAPALAIRRPNLTLNLRESSSSGSTGLLSLRRLIVSVQIALGVVLLVASGLFVRTLQKLRAVDVGFNTSHLASFSLRPNLAGYPPEKIPALQQRIIDSLTALPGFQAIAATDDPVLSGSSQGGNITVDGYTPAPEENMNVEKSAINAGFFSTLQVPLLTGRAFSQTDDATHPLVAIVNESFARHYFGSPQKAIGRRLADGASNKPDFNIEVVGVARDSKHTGIRDAVDLTVFQPLSQSAAHGARELYFYLRTAGAPADAFNLIRRSMQQLDPLLAVDEPDTMDAQIDQVLRNDSLVTLLAVSFGVLATVLAGIGLYGVLAFSITQRTREIGIRIALGSTRVAISRIVLADVLRLTALGVAVALPAAFGLGRLLRSQLFGVSLTDPVALVCAVLLITAVVLVAAIVPVSRAASVNPIEALRAE